MRELIVTEFVSADGVMDSPGGEPGYAHAGWVGPHFTPELGEYKLAEQLAADVLLLGRRTYEGFYGAWPQLDDPMADKINSMRKLVASTTLAGSDWHDTTVLGGDVTAAVAAVKEEDGGPMLIHGSRTLVHSLLDAGVVDELHLQVFPVALRSGRRIWPESPDTLELKLKSARPLPSGVVLTEYRLGR